MVANEAPRSEGWQHIDTVKRMLDAFAQRDIERALECIHPHVRLWVVTSAVTRGGRPYVGHEGIREYFEDVSRLWQQLDLLPLEFDAVGPAIIVVGEVRARGPAGRLRQPAVWTWKFRDQLVIDGRVDSDVDAARHALGHAKTIEELVQDYIGAFNRRDVEAMIALTDPNIVNYPTAISRGVRGGLVGHRGLRNWIRDVVANDPGHTIRAREVRKLDTDRWAVLGELVIDQLPVSPFASLIGVSDGGTITDIHEYLSEERLLRELGHLPSPTA